MKYAFMSFSAPEATLEELLAIAVEYGYEGLELRLYAKHQHQVETSLSQEERSAVKAVLRQSPITICGLASSCTFADPAKNEEQVAIAKQVIDLASDLGIAAVRVFGGKIPETVNRTEAVTAVVTALKQLGEYIGERSVCVCLETHDDWRNPYTMAEVMEHVNMDQIGLNWDVMHPVRAGFTIDEAFAVMKPWIKYVHIHDTTAGDALFAPIGEGVVDHKRVIELLASISYPGYLSGEWINWGHYSEYLGRELAIMKQYQQQLGVDQSCQ